MKQNCETTEEKEKDNRRKVEFARKENRQKRGMVTYDTRLPLGFIMSMTRKMEEYVNKNNSIQSSIFQLQM